MHFIRFTVKRSVASDNHWMVKVIIKQKKKNKKLKRTRIRKDRRAAVDGIK